MTTTQTDESPTTANTDDTTRADTSWASQAVRLAGVLASENFPRGDLAQLRRMSPDNPHAVSFWRLMARQNLFSNPTVDQKWALIIHGIALMTPTNNVAGNSRTAHNAFMPVGRALFLGGESRRSTGFYSESRLNRLLTARGPMLRTLQARLFRMLAAAGVSFNWREMASFILNEGYDEGAAEQGRRRIAREYYQAERRSAQSDTDSD